jgi:hypothetical protein
MAIKGKKRTKPKQVARAPRREPVQVSPPLFQRRWIQVVAAFIVGIFAMTLFVWVTNGLRQEDADSQAADAAATKLTAARAYQTAVESALGGVGTVTQGVPPTVFPDMGAALKTMSKGGQAPPDAASTFEDAQKSAKKAQDAISSYEVGTKINGKGFTVLEVTAFTGSSQELVQALQLYGHAAEVGAAAEQASGDQRTRLAGVANDLYTSAQTELNQGWSDYLTALSTGGIEEQLPALGATGSTGAGG